MSYAISGFFSVALLGIIGQVELSTGHIEGVFAYILAGALGMTAIVGYRENLPRKSHKPRVPCHLERSREIPSVTPECYTIR